MAIKVLVFESDPSFAETLRAGLLEYGCEVSVVDDANSGLQAASRDKPELILLAIELPRMNGFSVCNKLKRDPALKDVPLIIMSSESTEETFEQHRRLRTRAEEYVHKPITFEDLVARIQPFVPLAKPSLPAPAPADEASPASEAAIVLDDDIEIEDAEVVETVEEAPEAPAAAAVEVEVEAEADADVTTSTRESTVDADVEDFAEQAFGALIDEPEIAPPSIRPPEEVEVRDSTPDADEVRREMLSDAAELAAQEAELGVAPEVVEETLDIEETEEVEVAEVEVAEAEVVPSQPPPAPSLPPSVAPPPVPAKLSSLRPSSLPPRAAELGDVGKYREELEKARARSKELEEEVRRAKARVDELEEVGRRGAGKDVEVQRLQRELDDVKAKLASSGKGAGSAREFLDLREQLNKKDKEILDYKDQLSHKDKGLLALRDGGLVLEREKRPAGGPPG
jgi:DNA-binding response OmpR family regulator